MNLTEEQFYEIWERFAASNIAKNLPDNLEKYCEEKEITIDYFIQEFIWLNKNNKITEL